MHPTDRSRFLRLGYHVKIPSLRAHSPIERFKGLKCTKKARSRAFMQQGSIKVIDLGFGTGIRPDLKATPLPNFLLLD